TTILSSFGTSIMFLYPNFLIIASTISFVYFSFNLLNFCDLLPQLINHFAGRLGNADLLAVLYLEADSCGFAILHVHYVGDMNRSFLVNDAAVLIGHGRFGVLGNHVHTLYEHSVVLMIDGN